MTVSVARPPRRPSKSPSTSSGSGSNAAATISWPLAPTKFSLHGGSDWSPQRMGTPKVRHETGRLSYSSHAPVARSSAGHGISSWAAKNASRATSSPVSSPVPGLPGNPPRITAHWARALATSAAARPASRRARRPSPRRNRQASRRVISNGPMQHSVHPSRHVTCLLARRTAPANSPSRLLKKARSTSPNASSPGWKRIRVFTRASTTLAVYGTNLGPTGLSDRTLDDLVMDA